MDPSHLTTSLWLSNRLALMCCPWHCWTPLKLSLRWGHSPLTTLLSLPETLSDMVPLRLHLRSHQKIVSICSYVQWCNLQPNVICFRYLKIKRLLCSSFHRDSFHISSYSSVRQEITIIISFHIELLSYWRKKHAQLQALHTGGMAQKTIPLNCSVLLLYSSIGTD